MKTTKHFIKGTALGAIVSVGIMAAVPVLAYRGDPSAHGPDFSPERHEEMQQAFADHDYSSWEALMEGNGRKSRVLEVITEENFDTFAQIHDLMAEGNLEEARALREELGLGLQQGNGFGRFNGGGRGFGQANLSEEVREELRSCHDLETREETHECVVSVAEASDLEIPMRGRGKGFGRGGNFQNR